MVKGSKKQVKQDSVEDTQQHSPNWDEQVQEATQQSEQTEETQETQKTVKQEYPTESIANFDRSEVSSYEDMTMKDLSAVKALKVLIRRGEDTDNPNPALAGGCLKLLRMLNRERLHPQEEKSTTQVRRNFRREPFGQRKFEGTQRRWYARPQKQNTETTE